MSTRLIQIFTLAGVFLAAPLGAFAQTPSMGSLSIPGGAHAARAVLALGDPHRTPEAWYLDFAHKYHSRAVRNRGLDDAIKYVRFMTTLAAFVEMHGPTCVPAVTGADRSVARECYELAGVRLRERSGKPMLELEQDDDAKERRTWLNAAGIDIEAAVAAKAPPVTLQIGVAATEIPLPLPAYWQSRWPKRQSERLMWLMDSREDSLMYVGLMGLDQQTLRIFAHTPKLQSIAQDHSTVFAAFASSIHIGNSGVMLPGGDAARSAWEYLVGSRPSDSVNFVNALLSRDGGRLAWFYDVVAKLDKEHQSFILGLGLAEKPHRAFLRRVFDVFLVGSSDWRVDEAPFLRPAFHPGLAVTFVSLDHGQVGPAWWPSLLERVTASDAWPHLPASVFGNLKPHSADAQWMLEWLFEKPREAAGRFRLLRFLQRRFAGQTESAAPDIGVALCTLRAMPTLALTLERMRVTALPVMTRVSDAAHQLTESSGSDEGRARLANWQASLAVIDQVQLRVPMAASVRDRLLEGLAAATKAKSDAFDIAVAGWWVDEFVGPSLTADTTVDEVEPRWLASMLSPKSAQRRTVSWEALDYVISPGASTLRQTLEIRARRRVPHLGQLDRMVRIYRRIDSGLLTLSDLVAVTQELQALRRALADLPTINGKLPAIVEDYDDALKRLANIRQVKDLGKTKRSLDTLRRAIDAVFESVVRPLAYALAATPMSEAADVVVDAWFYHSMAPASETDARSEEQIAWLQPEADLGESGRIVRGSWLGLDVALADLHLRTPGGDQTEMSLVSAPESTVIARGAAFAVSAFIDMLQGLRAVPTALTAGRTRLNAVKTTDDLEVVLRQAGVDGARASVMIWRFERDHTVPAGLLGPGELFRLGAGSTALFGGATTAIDGCWCVQSAMIRPADVGDELNGVAVAMTTDLVVQMADELAAAHLPIELLPHIWPIAASDWLARVRQAWPGDWQAFGSWFEKTSETRFEDYVLFLIADGLLMPPDARGPSR